MGVRETARGLGCMAKGAGCLLAILRGIFYCSICGLDLFWDVRMFWVR